MTDHAPLVDSLVERIGQGLADHCFRYGIWNRLIQEPRLDDLRGKRSTLLGAATLRYAAARQVVPHAGSAMRVLAGQGPRSTKLRGAATCQLARLSHAALEEFRGSRDEPEVCEVVLDVLQQVLLSPTFRMQSPYTDVEVALPMRACRCADCWRTLAPARKSRPGPSSSHEQEEPEDKPQEAARPPGADLPDPRQ